MEAEDAVAPSGLPGAAERSTDMQTKKETLELFHEKLMEFIDHFRKAAEENVESIIGDPEGQLETLLSEVLFDVSNDCNGNGTPVTYGTLLDTISGSYLNHGR